MTANHMPKKNYLNADYGVLSWLLTKDHKRIAILYLVSVTLMFALGGLFDLEEGLRRTIDWWRASNASRTTTATAPY